MRSLMTWAAGFLGRFEFLIQTLTRLILGWVFVQSGWGKLTHLDRTIEFFQSLNIPFPQYQAPAVAFTELACGVLLIAGFATRFASVAMSGVMAVAIWTAKMPELEGWESIFEITEFTYILLFLWLVVRGAGPLSADGFLENNNNNR